MHEQNPHKHQFHIVNLSPWPIFTATALLILTSGGIMVMHDIMHYFKLNWLITFVGLSTLIYCAISWWNDVINEGRIDQAHTAPVQIGLRMGMGLFIITEIMFFVAIFVAYFKSSLLPIASLDGLWAEAAGVWPPAHIQTLDPWDVPFINTLILLLSGTTVTWAHYAISENQQQDAELALMLTIGLGIFFSFMQGYEYFHANFKFSEGIYPSNFYLATGFHGAHVILGTIFLSICYLRVRRGDFTIPNAHLGFEFAAWYWHFVDVVWLFLFTFVYVIG